MDIALCEGCQYQEPKQGEWCYMFRSEPCYCFKNLEPLIRKKNEEIERLKKERKWLLNECVGLCFASGEDKHTEHAEKRLLFEMQQALKEE